MHKTKIINIEDENRFLGDLGPGLIYGGGIVGGVGLVLALLLSVATEDNGLGYFFHSYLLNFTYFLSLALGALFFVATQHVTAAGWSVTIRRIAEFMALLLPWMLILFLPVLLSVLFGNSDLYHWNSKAVMNPESEHFNPLLAKKEAYLNSSFFGVRAVIYFGIWFLLARYLVNKSLEQDATGNPELTNKMQSFGAPALVLFALTLSFASFDWLMSLDGEWFSTIFGVYYFAGSALGFFATATLIAMGLQTTGRLTHAITIEHYHDMGKFLFGFIVFWAYIAFSQYMLIWYANIPEETQWFLVRQTNGWEWVSLTLIFGHFIIPFLYLMSRHVKRNKLTLAIGVIYVLIVHWIDIYWLVMPSLEGGSPFSFGGLLIDLSCLVGIGGLCVAGFAYVAGERSLVCVRDPRLHECLAFRNS